MRTNEERQQLIRRRTVEIQREQRRKRQNIISGTGVVLCLLLIIGVGYRLSGMSGQVSSAKINYAAGMASMLGNYDALGYICIGILSFVLGICVTVLLYRLRKMEEHRCKAEEYKQSERKDKQIHRGKSGENRDEV